MLGILISPFDSTVKSILPIILLTEMLVVKSINLKPLLESILNCIRSLGETL